LEYLHEHQAGVAYRDLKPEKNWPRLAQRTQSSPMVTPSAITIAEALANSLDMKRPTNPYSFVLCWVVWDAPGDCSMTL
jgi:hypothetical protein